MSAEDPILSTTDQTTRAGPDLPPRLWTYEDFTAAEAMPADFASGLVSLAFIRAAIRRSARLCCAAALAGLLIGIGAYLAFPPAYQASASVLITYGPYENVTTAPADDQAIAQSRVVAALAIHKLGLNQNVTSFLAAYSTAPVSTRVLLITASAPSASDAVSRANAVAAAFLQFRARQLETEQNLMLGSLRQQISQDRQKVIALTSRISQLSAQATSPAQQAELSGLQAERSQSVSILSGLEQTARGSPTTAATALAVRDSVVLDPAAVLPHSLLKGPLFYAAVGLVLSLGLAVGIVVVQAIISDRLRRRDDVAYALGAPVKLSVGAVRVSGWLPGRRGLAAARGADVQRIAAYLGCAVPARARGTAALAVVPIDDPQVAALSLVSLAGSRAQEGQQVVVADLCCGAPAASLLDSREPGIRPVAADGGHLMIVVPDPGDLLPAGPFKRGSRQAQRSAFTEAVAAATAPADLLLTLATLDPSLGGEHLATWATAAVAVVTAGKSPATRIHSVGEMIRLAGMTLKSAVLIGADKTDESLGMAHAPGAGYQPGRV